MRTFYSLREFVNCPVSSKKFVVTLGVFDGVHRGHQKIIKASKRTAKKYRLPTLLVTFDPHPAKIIRPETKVPLLISLKHRLSLLGDLGVDYSILFHFTKKLSRITAERFLRNICKKIRIKVIVVGENFFFGHRKSGSPDILREFSKTYGFEVSAVSTYKTGKKAISSTRIRQLILKGKLAEASRLLSRPVTVLGTVVKGFGRGRFIGFPTANIDPHHEVIPPAGVYAVRVRRKRRFYWGVLNIGTKPTFKKETPGNEEPTIEVHIFNFKKSIYGEDLEIIFVKRIRLERKFRDFYGLQKQIRRDSERAKDLLRRG